MVINLESSSSSTTLNDVDGMLITGTGDYACNSLFIPYSGYYDNILVAFVMSQNRHMYGPRLLKKSFRLMVLLGKYIEMRCW